MTAIGEAYGWLSDPRHAYLIGSYSTLFCIFWSSWIAFADLQFNSRMYTVMALFACAWLLVLGFYQTAKEGALSNLTSDVASLLMIYVGGLLLLEMPGKKEIRRISWLQISAFSLLVFIALPRDFLFRPNADSDAGLIHITVHQAGVVVSFALNMLAFASVAVGTLKLYKDKPDWRYRALILVFIFYAAAQLTSTILRWSPDPPKELLPAWIVYWYAVGKVAYAVVFGLIISHHERAKDYYEIQKKEALIAS